MGKLEENQKLFNSALKSEMEIKARVRRENYDHPNIVRNADTLRSIGKDFRPGKGIDYAGSFAVHLYRAPALGELIWVPQTAWNKEEGISAPVGEEAKKAVNELMHTIIMAFGGKPPTKRSGI